jgi:hypothetical protein
VSRSRLLTLLIALSLPVWLAACGGGDSGDGDSGSQDEDEISAAIERAATSGDPAACTDSQTANFNAQVNSGDQGDPTANCEQDAADTAADSVEVTNIQVDGDSATADLAANGSILDGQTLDVGLVKEGDQWKLDSISGFTEFDREAFTNAFISGLQEQGGELPAEALSCLQQQVQNASDEQLQQLILSPTGGDELFAPCG